MQIQEIVNRKFSRAFQGYDIGEVDAFLDEIIRDMERMEQELQLLELRNKMLLEELARPTSRAAFWTPCRSRKSRKNPARAQLLAGPYAGPSGPIARPGFRNRQWQPNGYGYKRRLAAFLYPFLRAPPIWLPSKGWRRGEREKAGANFSLGLFSFG